MNEHFRNLYKENSFTEIGYHDYYHEEDDYNPVEINREISVNLNKRRSVWNFWRKMLGFFNGKTPCKEFGWK